MTMTKLHIIDDEEADGDNDAKKYHNLRDSWSCNASRRQYVVRQNKNQLKICLSTLSTHPYHLAKTIEHIVDIQLHRAADTWLLTTTVGLIASRTALLPTF